MLEKSISAEKLLGLLVKHYGLTKESIQPQVEAFLQKCLQEQLILSSDQQQSRDQEKEFDLGEKSDWSEPTLDVFDDLEELINLDPVHDTDVDKGWPFERLDH